MKKQKTKLRLLSRRATKKKKSHLNTNTLSMNSNKEPLHLKFLGVVIRFVFFSGKHGMCVGGQGGGEKPNLLSLILHLENLECCFLGI